MSARYGGTALGRQELDGELIEDRADALWKRDAIEAARVAAAPALVRIVVAVDPRRRGEAGLCLRDHCGGDRCGRQGYVIADETLGGGARGLGGARRRALPAP